MTITPIAYFRSPYKTKFGIPRQSGVVENVEGQIVMEKEFSCEEAFRGIESFDFIWLIWEFSGNKAKSNSLAVRPPRLGGNTSVGVFASRSPFRPNNLGLSCVRLCGVTTENGRTVISVLGADLMDGTPIYDIKPYVTYADSHPDARSGFVDKTNWQRLDVEFPDALRNLLSHEEADVIEKTLSLDPRPHYHHDPERVYGMMFGEWDVRFRVDNTKLTILNLEK